MNIFDTRNTADGSKTFYSHEFSETFHTKYGAKAEAEITYVQGCHLAEKIKQQEQIKIIDICYGLGYNTAAAIDCIFKINPQCQVEIIALELDENVPRQALEYNLLNHWQPEIIELLTQLFYFRQVDTPQLKLSLWIDDARQSMIKLVQQNLQVDAIFLDPFSPPKCPQLWTVEFLSLLSQCLNTDGIIATYSCSAAIRAAFQLVGLKIGSNVGIGWRSPGTLAAFTDTYLSPLSEKELEHLKTRGAIPFRDPNLDNTAEMIKKRREEEQALSNLEFTSQWKKRWFSKNNFRKSTDDNNL
ncbi:SAM-dependent methyltransferase [Geminocystis sp. NIES-3708]|uniref:tRNA (5-methylaminomethyl-2-thiouridine)(34)-methyltransferase MnmD n=1 Tax=Geminocystis sp. NIES-3708 TaxID=1615909 RepID=UPI0005FCBDC3|nr:MnmC family methyltransferase [Geminocystis sp. NIES-3708]BAQ62487.1 SAM-dependent methyltransferase [Geminocystis sp. NIES-3708]